MDDVQPKPKHQVRNWCNGMALLAVLAFLLWRWTSDSMSPGLPAPDPRLAYTGPFQNIHPKVNYVSDDLCTSCHKDIAKSYHRHPMARTLTPIHQIQSPPLDAKAHNPFLAFGQRFQVEPGDGKVWHARTGLADNGADLFHQKLEAHYAIGSGTNAFSYLSIQGPHVLHSPVTWYGSVQRWDLSPGFQPHLLGGRRVGADCLFCHSNGANEDPKEATTYLQPLFPRGHGIGCQRCHGPGAKHVENPGLVNVGDQLMDPTIVNPAHLSPALRDAVCWQCHLEGEIRVLRRGRQRFDFRPGLPLEDFMAVFNDASETDHDHIVNHVEQMLVSSCYEKSTGAKKLVCVSCHNPHEKPEPAERIAYFRGACMKCHEEKPCSLPAADRLAKNKDDSCMACHMPAFATSNVPHVSATDHRIPRRPRPRGPVPQRQVSKKGPLKKLAPILATARPDDDPEAQRDWAVAAALLSRGQRQVLFPFDDALETAARRDRGDLLANSQYALQLIKRGEIDSALSVAKDVLAREKDQEWGLLAHALSNQLLGKTDQEYASWRRLCEVVPFHMQYRIGLIEHLLKGQKWQEATAAARAWLALDPGIPEGRAFLRDALFQLGKKTEADEQHRILMEITKRIASNGK